MTRSRGLSLAGRTLSHYHIDSVIAKGASGMVFQATDTRDGTVVAMAYGDSQVLKGLTPGQHSVQVDFVATDHIPFLNRVTAGVLFTVK